MTAHRWTGPVDILEGADDYLLLADLPGVKADDLSVTLDHDRLAITATTASGETLTRRFDVPRGTSEVEAHLVDGVLRVRLAKPAVDRVRRIEIATD